MVDQLMLQDIKNILKKLEIINSRDGFKKVLLDNDLENASEEEKNDFFVSTLMTSEEVELYRKYVLYKKRTALNNLVVAIDSLGELTSNVTTLYEDSSRCKDTICSINAIIEEIDNGLRDCPNIRISTEYNNVQISYKRYSDAFIKDGMDRAKFTEAIDGINHSGVIVRSLKKNKLKQLRHGLAEHNRNAKANVADLYDKYLTSKENYVVFLKEVMIKLLNKSEVLRDASLLSLSSMYGEDIPIKELSNGVKVVDKSKLRDISLEYIADQILLYFREIDEPEFDEKMFIMAFRDFLVHFYSKEILRLKEERKNILEEIRKSFRRQQIVMNDLATYREAVDIPEIKDDEDTLDTFGLVYENPKKNN